jgi:hypothetical protein
MEINLISLVMSILLLVSGGTPEEMDFKEYVQAYHGAGWSDPYGGANCSTQPDTLLAQNLYNGAMEEWCVNDDGTTDRHYGYLNQGTTQCNSSNSAAVDGVYDPLNNDMNKIPLYWKQYYGCCIDRAEDAYSGDYAALFSKQTTDDWYGMGMTKDGNTGTVITAKPEREYTFTLYYKMTVTTGRNPSLSVRFYDSNKNEIQRETKGFEPVLDYTYWKFSSRSPIGTAYIGWDIWFPPESILDLYVDELWIDEAAACQPGQSSICGTDVGACETGVRQCTDDFSWGGV